MKKVLILANFGMGLSNFREELIVRLIKEGYEVIVSFPRDEYVEHLESLGCKYIESKVDRRGINPINDLKLLHHYNSIFNEIEPDIVLSYTIKPNIYGGLICRKNKVPFIPNITGLGTSIERQGIISHIVKKMYKISLFKASIVFFQNSENLSFFKNSNILRSVSYILPGSGVNTAKFTLSEVPDGVIKNVLYIGRLMKEKGTYELLEAAEYCKSQNLNLNIQILGFPEDGIEEIILDYSERNIIEYFGQQRNVRPFIQNAHAIIQPSYHEGMSNVLLEAGASGRMLLSSNISGCKEIIEEGENGFLFESRDSISLINTLKKFNKLNIKKIREMGAKSRTKIVAEFDRGIIVKKYIEEINRITGGE